MAEQTPPKEKLVGDLETLVTLLEEGKDPTLDMFADEPVPVEPQLEESMPEPEVLPEVTAQAPVELAAEPSVELLLEPELAPEPEAPAPARAALVDAPTPQNQDLFDALLGTNWEAQSNELLETASATIQAQQLDWNPDDTQALTEALRVRLEQSINGWLNTTLAEQVELLRHQLLLDLQDELATRVQSTLQSNQQQRQTKEDGLSQLAEDPTATPGPDR